MPPEKDDNAYLWDMRRYLSDLESISKDKTLDDLVNDRVYQLAVERLIEIVGEAARHVTDATRAAHPEILWRGIQAQRHVIAHEYGDLDYRKLWSIVREHGPQLRSRLDTIVPTPPSDPHPEADA